jgi:putative membrane protein
MAWHLHPDAILMAVLLLGLYAVGARWAGGCDALPERVTRRQATLFALGVLTLYLGAGSPLHDWGEQYLLSAHMFQHLLFSLVAPPLLLLGTPGWMLRPLIANRHVRRVACAITRPFAALLIFNGVVLFTHLPYVADMALRNHGLHFVLHVALVGAALVMWMPILSPLPELPRIGPFAQLVYLFVQQLLPAVIASFLAFAENPIYPFYAEVPSRMWGLSVAADQQYAAAIMKLLGGSLLWVVMAAIFFSWFGKEDREVAARADIHWRDVEGELERMGLTKRG